MCDPVVEIEQGKLRGRFVRSGSYAGDYYSFQGIPFAEPPIGTLRFKDPKAPTKWVGILDATKEGPECPSKHMFFGNHIGKENNCLNLNVYTKTFHDSSNNLKPVMVFIHGGAFAQGSNKSDVYSPDFLLAEEIVLVVINYRLGPLGFLSLEDKSLGVPGNAGLKDQVMALKWVQKNIRTFGGDPNNVTIFGESAGAASVHFLVLSPLAKGLFHKAILQSGCAANFWAHGSKGYRELCKQLGYKKTDDDPKQVLEHLQKVSAKEIVVAQFKSLEQFVASTMRHYGPVIEEPSEEAFITDTPLNIIKSGNYNKVPMIIGYNSGEGLLFEGLRRTKPEFKLPDDFKLEIPLNLIPEGEKANLEEMGAAIKKFYYGNEEPSEANIEKTIKLKSDTIFVYAILKAAKLHKETSQEPLYLYRMSLETDLNFYKKICAVVWLKSYFLLVFLLHKSYPGICRNAILKMMGGFACKNLEGVSHADDLGYLFKVFTAPNIEAGSIEEISMKRFVQLWTNFAKYGNPTPRENCELTPWTVTDDDLSVLDIGKELSVTKNPDLDSMNFWDKLLYNN